MPSSVPRIAARTTALVALALAVTGLAFLRSATAGAEEPVRRQVGPYEITASYREAPLVEVDNALVIEVRDGRTETPVTGLERALRLDATVAPPRAAARPIFITLRPAKDRPGVYEGVFVPPSAGQYVFRLTGEIEGVPLDETFRSGPGGLPETKPAETDYASPGAYLAWGLLAVYLAGLGALGARRLRRGRRPAGPAVVSGSGA